ncbi:MAG: hypothetical protein Q8Q94_01345 [bacterium]|nr:hypothetical protein [bacterium]
MITKGDLLSPLSVIPSTREESRYYFQYTEIVRKILRYTLNDG